MVVGYIKDSGRPDSGLPTRAVRSAPPEWAAIRYSCRWSPAQYWRSVKSSTHQATRLLKARKAGRGSHKGRRSLPPAGHSSRAEAMPQCNRESAAVLRARCAEKVPTAHCRWHPLPRRRGRSVERAALRRPRGPVSTRSPRASRQGDYLRCRPPSSGSTRPVTYSLAKR